MTEARAFWVTGPEQGELRREVLPRRGPDEVLVQTLYSGVSRGTETLVYRNLVPPSEYQRMRAPFQQGEFPAPIKYGYCNVGTVLEGPEPLCGRSVFCLYPHQSHYVVPAERVSPLPDGVSPARAVLAANTETALNGLWDGGVGPGDRVAVVGAGVVGCLVATLAQKIPGVAVELVDVDPRKRTVAEALGVDLVDPAAARLDCDVVFEASGQPSGLTTALRLAGTEASVVALSWYGTREVTLPLGEAFHARRLRIVSSQVGTLPAERRARWTYARRLAVALSLLADDALGPVLDALLTDESSFEALPQTMASLTRPDAFVLCHRIRYR